MFCMKCGKPLPDGAMFCMFCGNKVDVDFIRKYMDQSAETENAPAAEPETYTKIKPETTVFVKPDTFTKTEPETVIPDKSEDTAMPKREIHKYQSCFSNQELYGIEGFDRIDKKDDPRSEQQLKNDIAGYLSYAELLDSYTIEREVSPSEFDADVVMDKHGKCFENGLHYTNRDIFDVNHYGKPASFVLRDQYGKIKLMIMVGKPGSYTHWLVQWCAFWCKDNRVPLLKFHVGYPNREHYVIRKTYEALGLLEKIHLTF